MKELLITYETAVLAKEKGFNNKTPTYYSSNTKTTSISYNEIPAPTQALLQKWLRDTKNIFITVLCDCNGKYDFHGYDVNCKTTSFVKIECQVDESGLFEIGGFPYRFDSYEEALETGLQEALKLIK